MQHWGVAIHESNESNAWLVTLLDRERITPMSGTRDEDWGTVDPQCMAGASLKIQTILLDEFVRRPEASRQKPTTRHGAWQGIEELGYSTVTAVDFQQHLFGQVQRFSCGTKALSVAPIKRDQDLLELFTVFR
jgi:hypothetical protein